MSAPEVTPAVGSAEERGSPPTSRSRRALEIALLAVGAIALVALVASTEPERVLATIVGAAAFVPLILIFDAAYFVCEGMAHRAVLGASASQVPTLEITRALVVSYCTNALAPLGRAGAEAARAAIIARHVGVGRATAAAANLQGAVLVANLVATVPCWIAVSRAIGADHPLSWLLLANGVGALVMGVVTLAIVRRSRLGAWMGARFPRFARAGAELDRASQVAPAELGRALAWCGAARVVQVGMYASLLLGVGVAVSASSTLVALGVHMVGAGFGDLVPGQIGVHETAYRVFADAIGLGDDPARALSIALLARLSQMVLAGLGLVALALWRRAPAAAVSTRG